MKTTQMLAVAAAVVLAGCQTQRPYGTVDDAICSALEVTIPEVNFRDAQVRDVIVFLHQTVCDSGAGTSFSTMPGDGIPGPTMSFQTNNITVGDVLAEMTRQTGLVSDIRSEALFVGSASNLARIAAIPPIPASSHPRLEHALDQRVEEFRACYAMYGDVSDFVMTASGIPLIVDYGLLDDCAFRDTVLVRGMKWRNFIWWMSVLHVDARPVLDGRAVHIRQRRSPTKPSTPTN